MIHFASNKRIEEFEECQIFIGEIQTDFIKCYPFPRSGETIRTFSLTSWANSRVWDPNWD